jgi:predicted Zn finger-like uncharacterized protein
MIVQCDQCNSKFRVDDSKVKEGGVKVRCSKCKNIFVVQAESPAEEGEFDSFLSGLMSGAEPGGSEVSPPAAEPPVSQKTPEKVEKPAEAELESTVEDTYQAQGDFDLSEFTFSEQPLGSEPPPSPVEEPLTAPRDDLDLSEFSFSEEPLASAPQPGQSSKAELHGDSPLDFGELDLGGLSSLNRARISGKAVLKNNSRMNLHSRQNHLLPFLNSSSILMNSLILPGPERPPSLPNSRKPERLMPQHQLRMSFHSTRSSERPQPRSLTRISLPRIPRRFRSSRMMHISHRLI